MARSDWSKELAIVDGLVAHRVPKARRHAKHRSAVLRVLQPDPLLDVWSYVLNRVPTELAPFAEQVFVLAPLRDDEMVPYAAASGNASRRIVVPREFHWIQRIFTAAFVEIERSFQAFYAAETRGGPKRILAPTAALTTIADFGRRFGRVHEPSARLGSQLDLLVGLLEDPARIRDIVPRAAELGLDSERVNNESVASLVFVLGHELAHHLMNDTWPKPDATVLGTKEILESWLDSIGVELPPNLEKDHRKELLCDAFSGMLSHQSPPRSDLTHVWAASVVFAGGAFTSLLALELFGEGVHFSNPSDRIARLRSETHPSLEARAALLGGIMLAAAPDYPGGPTFHEAIGRSTTGSSDGYALLLLACSAALHELIRRHLDGDLRRSRQ